MCVVVVLYKKTRTIAIRIAMHTLEFFQRRDLLWFFDKNTHTHAHTKACPSFGRYVLSNVSVFFLTTREKRNTKVAVCFD